MTECCPKCGRPFQQTALGVFMPPRKAAIVNSIKASGDIGITSYELMVMHYGSEKKKVKQDTIKAHIWQINDQWLDLSPWEIISDGQRWFVHKRRELTAPPG